MYKRIPIPDDVRLALAEEPQVCELCGVSPVQWHHNLESRGSAVQEKFAIVKLCHKHHRNIWSKEIKKQVDKIMLLKMNDSEVFKYKGIVRVLSKRYESDPENIEIPA